MTTSPIAACGTVLLAALLLPAHAAACTSQLECGAGAQCVKSAGAIYGQCVQDVMPQEAAGTPSPLAATAAPGAGRQCAFDSDCGKGRVCLKTAGNAAGMCVAEHAPPAR